MILRFEPYLKSFTFLIKISIELFIHSSRYVAHPLYSLLSFIRKRILQSPTATLSYLCLQRQRKFLVHNADFYSYFYICHETNFNFLVNRNKTNEEYCKSVASYLIVKEKMQNDRNIFFSHGKVDKKQNDDMDAPMQQNVIRYVKIFACHLNVTHIISVNFVSQKHNYSNINLKYKAL